MMNNIFVAYDVIRRIITLKNEPISVVCRWLAWANLIEFFFLFRFLSAFNLLLLTSHLMQLCNITFPQPNDIRISGVSYIDPFLVFLHFLLEWISNCHSLPRITFSHFTSSHISRFFGHFHLLFRYALLINLFLLLSADSNCVFFS